MNWASIHTLHCVWNSLEWQAPLFSTLGYEKYALKFKSPFILRAKEYFELYRKSPSSGQRRECENNYSNVLVASATFICSRLALFCQAVTIMCRFPEQNNANAMHAIPAPEKVYDFHPLSVSNGEIGDAWGKERLTPFLFVVMKCLRRSSE